MCPIMALPSSTSRPAAAPLSASLRSAAPACSPLSHSPLTGSVPAPPQGEPSASSFSGPKLVVRRSCFRAFPYHPPTLITTGVDLAPPAGELSGAKRLTERGARASVTAIISKTPGHVVRGLSFSDDCVILSVRVLPINGKRCVLPSG